MPIDFTERQRLSFATATTGIHKSILRFEFNSPVRRAQAVICGFNAEYNGFDKPLRQFGISTVVSVNTVTKKLADVHVELDLRDGSGNFDDAYKGYVDIILIVERE